MSYSNRIRQRLSDFGYDLCHDPIHQVIVAGAALGLFAVVTIGFKSCSPELTEQQLLEERVCGSLGDKQVEMYTHDGKRVVVVCEDGKPVPYEQ